MCCFNFLAEYGKVICGGMLYEHYQVRLFLCVHFGTVMSPSLEYVFFRQIFALFVLDGTDFDLLLFDQVFHKLNSVYGSVAFFNIYVLFFASLLGLFQFLSDLLVNLCVFFVSMVFLFVSRFFWHRTCPGCYLLSMVWAFGGLF